MGTYVNNATTVSFSYKSGNFATISDGTDQSGNPNPTTVTSINNLGQIAGGFVSDSGVHGFILSNGVFTQIDAPNNSGYTQVLGINDLGYLVGDYVDSQGNLSDFIDKGGQFTVVVEPNAAVNGTMGGLETTTVSGINNSSHVVGRYVDSNGVTHGFEDQGGTYNQIDDPSLSGKYAGRGSPPTSTTADTYIFGINDSDTVLGAYEQSNPTGSDDFTYNSPVFSVLPQVGSGDLFPGGINDSGQIVGQYQTSDGKYHGYLLTPVAAPNVTPSVFQQADTSNINEIPEPRPLSILVFVSAVFAFARCHDRRFIV